MPNQSTKLDVAGFFKKLCDAFGNLITWAWDERYATVVGEFERENAERVIEILEHHFSAMWDGAVIGSASDLEQEVTRQLGGIEPGQALYTTDPSIGEIVFCAWWRWGNGQRFSLRVGASTLLPKESADPAAIDQLRNIFSVQD